MDDAEAQDVNVFAAMTVAVNDAFQARLSRLGVSASQAACLATLRAFPGDSIDQIAGVTGLTGSGTTRLVAQLVQDGLVVKSPGADARSVAASLTERGEAAADAVLRARHECFGDLFQGLDVSERGVLGRLSRRLLATFEPTEDWADRTCRFCDYATCPQQSCPVACASGTS